MFIILRDNVPPEGVYTFKKIFSAYKTVDLKVNIFAATRYMLYINNVFICEGPCKGAADIRYFDTVTVNKSLLRSGNNEIKVSVMHLSTQAQFSTVYKTAKPMLLFEAVGTTLHIKSDKSWECFRETGHSLFYPQGCGFKFISPFEKIDSEGSMEKLEICEGEDFDFEKGFRSKWGVITQETPELARRPIPMLFPDEKIDLRIIKRGENYVELDANEYVTAKPQIILAPYSKVKIIYSECYAKNNVKAVRDDSSGELTGYFDIVSTGAEKFCFSPFGFRAFRFIRIEADNADSAVISVSAKRYYYPINIASQFSCSDKYYNQMYRISINTMLCCTHETFVDCPYYEQQQYIMDSTIESYVLAVITHDAKMIRKCISEFAASQQPSGLLCANYPSDYLQIIPGFSLYFIFMLRFWLEYSGEVEFVRKYISVADGILTYFDEVIKKHELIKSSRYWDFIDWVSGWKRGTAPIAEDESITVYNLYLLCALKDGAYICEKTGRTYLADEYVRRYNSLLKQVQKKCFDNNKGLFKDGEKTRSFCVHNIIWAILSNAVSGDAAKEMISHINDSDVKQCSFSMRFFLFRALEKCGCFFANGFDDWKKMIDFHCTTWCESPDAPRSECHGWSSAPLYELMTNILGVKYNIDDGLTVAPCTENLEYANGTVPTPVGDISINWKKENGLFVLCVTSTDAIHKRIIMPDGSSNISQERKTVLYCKQ